MHRSADLLPARLDNSGLLSAHAHRYGGGLLPPDLLPARLDNSGLLSAHAHR